MQHAQQPYAANGSYQPPATWPYPHPGAHAPVQLAPMAPPVPGHAASARVVGGGGAPATATRLRWGRLLLAIAGIALVAIAIWSAGATTSPAAKDAPSAARDIGGATTPLTKDEPAKDAATAAAGADAKGAAIVDSAPTDPIVVPRVAKVARPAATAPAAATAPVTGGGGPAATTSDAPLPYTGAETWIAAILGVLILGLGIAVQINAVRIGMTAMLYRRGILLRPVDCARLAGEHGFGQVRVTISNALLRLLAEPEGVDFVHARRA